MKRQLHRGMGWVTVCIVLADWLSKFLVLNRIALQQKIAVFDGWFYLLRVQNRGVAFGILNQGVRPWRTSVLVFTASLVLWLLARLSRSVKDTTARVGIALIAGGALGNLGDRVANGGVTDFLAFRAFPYVFNIADAAILAGAVFLTLSLASSDTNTTTIET